MCVGHRPIKAEPVSHEDGRGVHERSGIADERADEALVEQFVGHGFLRCGLTGSRTSLVGTREQSFRTGTAFQYGKPGAGPEWSSARLWQVAVQHAHPIPLVGRDAEQSALALALRTAKQGAFRCIVIDGEPGIGKTRLAIARGYQGLRRMRLQMAS
jgi:hypothetical protein